jgi:hypothetical protein
MLADHGLASRDWDLHGRPLLGLSTSIFSPQTDSRYRQCYRHGLHDGTDRTNRNHGLPLWENHFPFVASTV